MSKFAILFLLFNFTFSQEPAPYLKINVDKLVTGEKESVFNDYEFFTALGHSQIDITFFNNKHNFEDQFIKEEGKFIYLFISAKFAPSPQKGEIISLGIRNKVTRQNMTVHVRIAKDIAYGMPVEVTNLNFMPGNYFIDLCLKKSTSSPYSIDLSLIKSLSTSCTKINKLLRTYKCSP